VNFDENWGSKLDGLFDLALRYVHVNREDAWSEGKYRALEGSLLLNTYLRASIVMKMFSGFNETQHYVGCRNNSPHTSRISVKAVGLQTNNYFFYY
jgi:hypothetical protein